jgi:hypothetical protein
LKNWTLFIVFARTAVSDGNVGESGSRIRRLVTAVDNAETLAWLKLETDVVVITMKPFVEATYLLEGKGPCAIIAYDMVVKIDKWFSTHEINLTFPGMEVAVTSCWTTLLETNMEITRDVVVDKVKGIIKPAYEYFRSRIFGMLKEDLDLYRVLRYTNPIEMIRFLNEREVYNRRKGIEALPA